METEKIEVVCKSTKTKCDKDCTLWDGFGGECKMADVISGYIKKGDTIKIEIIRK